MHLPYDVGTINNRDGYARMADTPEKKKLTTRLRDIFKRSSRPPVPADIVNDKRVQKAVLKNHRRKRWRALRNVALVSTAISTILQFNPDIVSSSYDDHMAARGYTAAHQENFYAREVRVLDRGGILLPFYTAGRSVIDDWQQADRNGYRLSFKLVTAPFNYMGGFMAGMRDALSDGTIDAWTKTYNLDYDQRTVYIRPPKDDFTVTDFLREFAGMPQIEFNFRHDNKDISRVLYEYVMLHEARHGDQDLSVSTPLNEADADRYAFSVLATRGYDAGLLQEVREIVTHGRTMASVLGGGTHHATSLSLQRPYPTPFDAYEDGAAFRRLHNILADAAYINKEQFEQGTPVSNRMISVAAALFVQGTLNDNQELRAANNHFRMATIFFQHASGFRLFDAMQNLDRINVDYLKQPYAAVPDKPASEQSSRPVTRPNKINAPATYPGM